MKLRKRFMVLLTVICTLCGMAFSTPVFATEATSLPTEEVGVVDKLNDDSVVPYGSLSGYGYVWHNTGEPAKRGDVSVTGIPWHQGHLTVSLEKFNSNTKLKI